MKRRDLLRSLAASGAAGAALGSTAARAQPDDEELLLGDIDPYFLDSGELSASEQAALIEVEQLQEQLMQGRPVVIPRGLRPARAPTYRLVHWAGDLGDSRGRFVSPLSVVPELGPLQDYRSYRFNGQILGFHGAKSDWGQTDQGTLTVELRAPLAGQPMTWLFAQQFDIDDEGFSNIGYQYVAQRGEAIEPVITDEPNLGLRIQMLRSQRRAGVLFRKILRTALAVTGVPLQLENQDVQTALQALPPMRVPAMFQEGAALAQAIVGSMAQEPPLWRGGFSSYGIARGGSKVNLQPGFWAAIDVGREVDLREVMLEEVGPQVGLTRGGEPLDANYVVFGFEIDEGPAPSYLNLCGDSALPQFAPDDGGDESAPRAVPKSAPPAGA